MEKQIKIALAGNPNCGKTTLFNALTGSNQFVGNWPGVTVEKKEGRLKKHDDVVIIDLPGIYSLSPYTGEEVVSRQFILNDKPDAIIDIATLTGGCAVALGNYRAGLFSGDDALAREIMHLLKAVNLTMKDLEEKVKKQSRFNKKTTFFINLLFFFERI